MNICEAGFITRSIELAGEAGANGNRPFGAVFVAANGTVLAEGRNEVSSNGDITAHAELVAIRNATAGGLTEQFAGSAMYASGEPCPMCAAACVWAGVAKIVFAASTEAFALVLPEGPHFYLSCASLMKTTDANVTVIGPVDEAVALNVMRSQMR